MGEAYLRIYAPIFTHISKFFLLQWSPIYESTLWFSYRSRGRDMGDSYLRIYAPIFILISKICLLWWSPIYESTLWFSYRSRGRGMGDSYLRIYAQIFIHISKICLLWWNPIYKSTLRCTYRSMGRGSGEPSQSTLFPDFLALMKPGIWVQVPSCVFIKESMLWFLVKTNLHKLVNVYNRLLPGFFFGSNIYTVSPLQGGPSSEGR